MKTTLTLALALLLGTGTAAGIVGCNKTDKSGTSTEKKVETTGPGGAKTETTEKSSVETKKTDPDKK